MEDYCKNNRKRLAPVLVNVLVKLSLKLLLYSRDIDFQLYMPRGL